MYLRHPWSLAVAVGLTIAFAVVLTLRVESGNLRSNVIINAMILATGLAWHSWITRATSTASAEKTRREEDAETAVRRIRS